MEVDVALDLLAQPIPPFSPPFSLFDSAFEQTFAQKQHVAAAARDRYAAARFVDACAVMGTPQSPNWDACINSFTLSPMLTYMHELPYTTDIADVRCPIVSTLGKCLWAKCQARKSATMAEKLLLPDERMARHYEHLRAQAYSQSTHSAPQRAAKGKKPHDQRFMSFYQSMKERCTLFQRMMACSLLGNWPDVVAERIWSLEGRKRMYARVMNPHWFQAALHGCSVLFVWCLREFFVHMMENYPGLRSAVGPYIHYDKMKPLICEAMQRVRAYFNANLPHDWTDLGAFNPAMPQEGHYAFCSCLRGQKNNKRTLRGSVLTATGGSRPRTCAYSHLTWTKDIAAILRPFHERMLKEAYRKPDRSYVQWFMGRRVRVPYPLVLRPLTTEEKEAQDEMLRKAKETEEEEQQEEELVEAIEQMYGQSGSVMEATARYKSVADDLMKRNKRKKRAAFQDAHVVARVFRFLAPHQFAWLAALVDRLPGVELQALVPFFDQLGVTDPRVLHFIQSLLNHCKYGTLAYKQRMRYVEALQQREPHAYNLVQVAAELIRRKNQSYTRVVGQLSSETTQAQIRALQARSLLCIQTDDLHHLKVMDKVIHKVAARASRDPQRWGLLLDQVRELKAFFVNRIDATARAHALNPLIDTTSSHLYYCNICHVVYSNYRSARHPERPYYRWGLNSAWRNHSTGTLHCQSNLVDFTGQCSSQPLTRVNLLGVRFAVDKRVFQLCVGCGDILQLSSTLCMDAGEGLLCIACTRKHREAMQAEIIRPAVEWVKQLDRHCAICGDKTVNDEKTTLLPFGVVLCSRGCRTRHVMREMHQLNPDVLTRAEFLETLRDIWYQGRSMRKDRLAKQGERKMKMNRMRNRQRKA